MVVPSYQLNFAGVSARPTDDLSLIIRMHYLSLSYFDVLGGIFFSFEGIPLHFCCNFPPLLYSSVGSISF